MNTKNILLLAFMFALTFSSCNKDEDPPVTPTQTYANPSPSFGDADGVLAAVQVISYQTAPIIGEFAVYADVATGGFFDGASAYFDAGTVSVNAFDLQSVDNNVYILPGQGSTVIDFDFDVNMGNSWSVAGSANVPMFTHTTGRGMPGDIKFDGDFSTVNTGTDLTVSIETAPSFADSILFVVAIGNTTLTKTVAGNAVSATFTSAEMAGSTGTGVVQVAAYNYEFNVVSGKKYYFVNENVISQVATFN